MSLECSECERDARAGHDENCSRYRPLTFIIDAVSGITDPPNDFQHADRIEIGEARFHGQNGLEIRRRGEYITIEDGQRAPH